MSDDKVKEKDFNEVPNLLPIFVLNQDQFNVAECHQESFNFHNDEYVADDSPIKRGTGMEGKKSQKSQKYKNVSYEIVRVQVRVNIFNQKFLLFLFIVMLDQQFNHHF
jgi:hypothetical protein